MNETVQYLISCLIQMKDSKSSLILSISNIDLVLEGLNELDDMIEIHEVKNSIVTQIKFLLINSVNMKEKNFDGHMVHTVLSGPPGSGKTNIGIILAKIWTGLGLLKAPSTNNLSTNKIENDKIETLEKQINNLNNTGKVKNGVIKNLQLHLENIKQDVKNIEPNLSLSLYKLKTLKRELEKNQDYFHRSCVRTIEDIIEIQDNLKTKVNEIHNNTIVDENVSFILPVSYNSMEIEIDALLELSNKLGDQIEKIKDKDIIKIVSREDFVGGFLGQTAIKTEKLLRDNFGKILFIDEAYSLVNDEKDSFGREALTVLNRFMSEYSDQIIIIFAGYKDMMDQTIFTAQPGLKRRCSWYFEIKNYTEKGLAQIFEKQLNSSGWEISSDVDLVSFFKTNIKQFPSFGGSTLQLTFYCKLAYSCKIFDQNVENDMIIDFDILNSALKYLKDNSINPTDTFPNHLYL